MSIERRFGSQPNRREISLRPGYEPKDLPTNLARTLELLRTNKTPAEIARAHGIQEDSVRGHLAQLRARGYNIPKESTTKGPSPKSLRIRESLPDLWREGLRTSEIAQRLGIEPKDVRTWMGRLRKEGMDLPKRPKGNPGKR